jgi:MraZ protein
MFFGQYEHTIDEKGRLTIPSRYRDLLQNGAYITQGFEQNLMVLTTTAFEQVYARINRMSLTDPIARQLKRLIFSYADRVEVDRVGRILIPQFLRVSAQLNGAAVMVGVGNHFEIWSPDRWQEQKAMLQDGEANTHRYAAFEITVS